MDQNRDQAPAQRGKKGTESASTNPRSRGIAPLALTALGAFVCAALPLGLMVWNASKLVSLGLVGNLYYFVLVVLGLLAALVLFGILHSYARYRGQHFGGVLELGGPIVCCALVVVGGFILVPRSSAFPLTVYVHGERGVSDLVLKNAGKVVLDIGPDRRQESIGEKGQAYFLGIPAEFRGQKVSIWVVSEEFETQAKDQNHRMDSDSTYLLVQRKPARISGFVRNDQGQPVVGATVSITGLETNTDNLGRFEFTISGGRPKQEFMMHVASPGFEPWNDTVVPNSNEATVILHRSP